MSSITQHITICGAGGIGTAAALLLTEHAPGARIVLMDVDSQQLNAAATFLGGHDRIACVQADLTQVDRSRFSGSQIVLDCLPGRFAPTLAESAFLARAAYANLTEYVQETIEVRRLAESYGATAVIQTGLAPGYINVLGMVVLDRFMRDHQVSAVDALELRVGALTQADIPIVHYGWTWSTIGVATEYLEDATALRGGRKVELPSLSEREEVVVEGVTYEADLTSGGAADLPEKLEGRLNRLDYKTLRYPGHYDWVLRELASIGDTGRSVEVLEQRMREAIPFVEQDVVVLCAVARGRDRDGRPQCMAASKRILPMESGGRRLRAIQSTTAAPLVQNALDVLAGRLSGIVTQSMLGLEHLEGPVVRRVYGSVELRK